MLIATLDDPKAGGHGPAPVMDNLGNTWRAAPPATYEQTPNDKYTGIVDEYMQIQATFKK